MKLHIKLIIPIIILTVFSSQAQINTDQIQRVGQNALYFEDYMLSIQYFNQVIQAKPYLAQPYFFRSIAKLNLEDFLGAEEDATLAIERNKFITDAYEVRGVARQNMGKLAEAIEDYSHALEMLPDNRGILFNKALAQEEMKNYGDAEKSYEQLLKKHPRFDNGYVGRAKLRLATGDTINALEDLDMAISLNKNLVNAYVLRADIAIKNENNFQRALADMNEAIKLQPHYSGFFVNRAFLRYKLDDYFGAMADYDYAITLDPASPVAYFNRGLLRAEVHDRDRAIADFSKVLDIDPDDYRSLFNRAMLYRETKNYKKALADIDRVAEAFPDFDGVFFTRFQIYDEMGDKRNAERDYNKALALSKRVLPTNNDVVAEIDAGGDTVSGGSDKKESAEPDELVSKRFTSLLTIENDHDVDREYNNKSIRGRVQDRNVTVEICPMFMMTYYATTNQLKDTPYYIKEVDDINMTRSLRFLLMVSNVDAPLSDSEAIKQHFNSIDYYNSYIATHPPRAIDYFGRAMDFMTIRNYKNAIDDFSKAIELMPDFTAAYYMRAIANYKRMKVEREQAAASPAHDEDIVTVNAKIRIELKSILADFDKVIELSPRMAFAYYNKGVVLAEAGDNTTALGEFSKAIELKKDLGEAYYNRGYIYMQLGRRDNGVADLSKAGELGVLPSYNLLKRMSR